MAKKSQLDKVAEGIEAEIAILQAALNRVRQQQQKAPVRRPRAVKANLLIEKTGT